MLQRDRAVGSASSSSSVSELRSRRHAGCRSQGPAPIAVCVGDRVVLREVGIDGVGGLTAVKMVKYTTKGWDGVIRGVIRVIRVRAY